MSERRAVQHAAGGGAAFDVTIGQTPDDRPHMSSAAGRIRRQLREESFRRVAKRDCWFF
jgi:hypothetical protein